jgi:hypothetical protein
MSIIEKLKEIKGGVKNGLDFENPTQKNAFLAVFVILVACASFGLGRLSGLETVKKEVSIEFPKGQEAAVGAAFATTSAQIHAPQKTSGKYVASKNGTKYYLTTCASAKRISDKNKVWFDTKQEAETAGYTPAANCKGM